MLAAPLLLLVAGQTAAPHPPIQRDIVVTGVRLEDSERDWKLCRARDCPPDQEIEAALGHGENLFVAGDYAQARSVLATTIRNTRGAAKRFPTQVGDLRRAEARVASHLGEDVQVRVGMLAARDALAAGLGEDDPRVLAQRLQVADAMMLQPPRLRYNLGDVRPYQEDKRRVALRTYEAVAEQAQRLDLPDLLGRALVRRAALLVGFAAANPRGYDKPARGAIDRVTQTTDPRLAPFRDAARVLRARLDARTGGEAAVDRLVQDFDIQAGRLPVLLYAPPIDWNASRDRAASLAKQRVAQNEGQRTDLGRTDEWVDIAFAIGADGRVADAELLRESDGRAGDWTAPVLAAVRARRYARLALPPGTPGLSRVERHTYTASYGAVTGSNLRLQTGVPRVVVTDMTLDGVTAERATAPAG